MKLFQNVCAQGDVLIRRIDKLPETAMKEDTPENGKLIVTHSETGHHHSMVLDREESAEANVRMFTSDDNPLISWLEVNRPTALEHERSFDTHDPIQFDNGVYEVRRQREYTPEGYRRVED